MIRVIKQYGISILLLIVAILCIFNIGQNIQDAFTVITNSLAIFLAIFYFVNFERDIIIKIKSFILNIKWPFHGKSKKILNNLLNFIIEKRWDIISYLFIFLLLIITLGQFSYLERFINLSWINKYQVILTVLAILSGGLTFWNNREKVEKEIDQEQIAEQGAEDKRKADFASKFPRINKVPVLRNLVRWMYKEGWGYSIPLVLITLIFITIKIGMPIIFTGSYIDEYFHILSGLNFNEQGKFAEMYFGNNYSRSPYISIMAAGIIYIFGKSLLALKIIPIVVGLINYYFLISISRKIITSKNYQILLFTVYTFSPFVILNHFYIRFNVFYELIILILIFLFIKIDERFIIKGGNKVLCAIFVFIIAIANLILNNDSLRYLGILLIALFSIHIFIFRLNKKNIFKNIKIILPIIFLSLIFIFLYLKDDLYNIFSGTLNDSAPVLNISNINTVFFENYFIFTVFLLLSIFLFIIIKKSTDRLIILIGLSIFILHIFSSPELKIIRGIFYFLPIYYLVSIRSLEIIKFGKIETITIISLIILSIFNSYPKYFFNEPQLKNDLNYQNYQETFVLVNDKCQNSITIALIHFPDIAYFYDTKIDYTNYIYHNLLIRDNRYHYENNMFTTNFTNIPVIEDIDLIKNLLESGKKICIITYGDYEHAQRYISYYEFYNLLPTLNIKELKGFRVYSN